MFHARCVETPGRCIHSHSTYLQPCPLSRNQEYSIHKICSDCWRLLRQRYARPGKSGHVQWLAQESRSSQWMCCRGQYSPSHSSFLASCHYSHPSSPSFHVHSPHLHLRQVQVSCTG